QIDAIWTAEAVASGTEITTPGGLLARINIGVGDTGQFDAAAAVVPNNSIAIFTTTGGQDLASLIDAIYDANV
ncbi:MAG TPA: hypothetical protein PLV68_07910, partial [Ilumatobacteraceae bacterium]|nr:hypothetical protein [Ilumatobacteraceae bacterium]